MDNPNFLYNHLTTLNSIILIFFLYHLITNLSFIIYIYFLTYPIKGRIQLQELSTNLSFSRLYNNDNENLTYLVSITFTWQYIIILFILIFIKET